MISPPTDESPCAAITVAADTAELSRVRHAVIESARRRSADPTIADDLSLVASELMTTAIQHSDADVTVIVERSPDAWAIEVSGTSAHLGARHDPSPSSTSWPGMLVVEAIMDSVEIVQRADGVRVRCTKFATS